MHMARKRLPASMMRTDHATLRGMTGKGARARVPDLGFAPKSGSHRTLRRREPDSNHRSRSCERLFWALPIGDGGTKGGATYRFRSETAMLAWRGCS